MLPFLIIGIFIAVVAIIAILKGPSKENNVVSEINERLKREEEQREEEQREEEQRKNEQEARESAKGRKRPQESAEIQRQEDNADMIHRRQDEIRERKAKVQTYRINQTDDNRNMEEYERVAKQTLEEEEVKLEQLKKEKRKLPAKMERLRIEEERVEKEAKQLADHERAVREKFGNLRWPTRDESQQALRDIQYDKKNFHFAIVGRAGSGKSSLINAFRNLKNKKEGAARTGTKETTLCIKRYEDPGEQPPRQCMVWFDVPGAGTQRIPHHDYFIKQGLYVFDFIILAIGDRFEEIDARILEHCLWFKIPVFIVRSKADMHILNSMKEEEEYGSGSENSELYKRCREEYIRDTQQMVDEELKRCGLPEQIVYIVSRDELREVYNNSLQLPSIQRALWEQKNEGVIHEGHLVKALLDAAAEQRCENQTPLEVLMDGCSALGGAAQEFLSRQCQNFSSRFTEQPKEHEPRATAREEVGSDTKGQPAHQNKRGIRKIVRPRKSTDSEELYREISERDPELPNMLIGKPIMFSSYVAMLTFYPLASIPESIYAFGSKLRVEEYKDKRMEKSKKERQESYRQAE